MSDAIEDKDHEFKCPHCDCGVAVQMELEAVTEGTWEISVKGVAATDPTEPELPEVKVFDAITPDGRKCRCTKIAGFKLNRAVMIGSSGPFITEFRDDELTDKRPVEPKPPAPSDLIRRVINGLKTGICNVQGDTTVESEELRNHLRDLVAELRKHTDPVAVTADELERSEN